VLSNNALARDQSSSNSEKCGLEFSNSLVVEDPHIVLHGTPTESQQRTTEALHRPSQHLSPKPALLKRKLDDQEDLVIYRRVRLRLTQHRFRLKVYALRNNDWPDLGTGFGKHTVSRGPVVRSNPLSYHSHMLNLFQLYTYITVISENDPDHTISNGEFDQYDSGMRKEGGKREVLHFLL